MNAVVLRLAALGFINCEALSEKKAIVTVRIRTSRGWTYEKFDSADIASIDLWAKKHEPELEQ